MAETRYILVLNRSFWPDMEATGQFLTELCEELAKKYKITVVTGRSYYGNKEKFGFCRFWKREIFNEIEILRVRHTRFCKGNLVGRITNWLTYTILAFLVSFNVKPKIVIVGTDSPFLGIVAMIIYRLRNVPFIYNCRDLFPDVAVELGKLEKNNILNCGFDYFNKKAFNSASTIVCLGKSMEDRIRKKGVNSKHFKVITDWVDISKIKPVLRKENPLIEKFGFKDKFVIMYSGNIGLLQDFGLILQAVKKIEDKFSFYLVFIGEGAGKEKLKDEVASLRLKNVLFLPYQPLDLLSYSLSMADLHLITLKKGIAGTVVPSKLYGIMAVGRPYLAITDKESEPASFALEFNCGLWAEPDDLDAISNKLIWALQNPVELERMGRIGRHLAETRFDKKLIVNKWVDLLEKLS